MSNDQTSGGEHSFESFEEFMAARAGIIRLHEHRWVVAMSSSAELMECRSCQEPTYHVYICERCQKHGCPSCVAGEVHSKSGVRRA